MTNPDDEVEALKHDIERHQNNLASAEERIEVLQDAIHSLQIMLEARKEMQRQKFERILSMLREVMVVLEVYIKE